jgi:Tfp pilus assembly protein PilW
MMRRPCLKCRPNCGAFTLVELLVGMSLALVVMTAVLTTYITLGRNFTRSLGISSSTQPTLESQARRTLAYFVRDARMAIQISGTPSASSVTLQIPSNSNSPTTVVYSYSGGILTRTLSGGSAQTLHSNLLTCVFTYYDSSGNPYTAPYTNYLPGIKQVSLTLTSQAGSGANGTLTQVYRTDSPRVIIRNKALL